MSIARAERLKKGAGQGASCWDFGDPYTGAWYILYHNGDWEELPRREPVRAELTAFPRPPESLTWVLRALRGLRSPLQPFAWKVRKAGGMTWQQKKKAGRRGAMRDTYLMRSTPRHRLPREWLIRRRRGAATARLRSAPTFYIDRRSSFFFGMRKEDGTTAAVVARGDQHTTAPLTERLEELRTVKPRSYRGITSSYSLPRHPSHDLIPGKI